MPSLAGGKMMAGGEVINVCKYLKGVLCQEGNGIANCKVIGRKVVAKWYK